MKQAEEIKKAEAYLSKIRQELQAAEEKLDKNITRQIEQRKRKIKSAYNKIRAIKEAFVSPITDNPKAYINGSSRLMKKELWKHSYEYEQMWHIFAEEVKNIPKIVELKETMDRLENEIDEIATEDYKALLREIDDLERDMHFKERHVENLKDIGWFRQYAKDVKATEKATEERQKKEAIVAEKKKEFQKKIEKEYLPLMKKSAKLVA